MSILHRARSRKTSLGKQLVCPLIQIREQTRNIIRSLKTCQSSGGSSTSGLSWSTSPIEDDWNGTIVDYNSAPWLDAPPKTITLHFVVNDQGTVTEETLTAKEVPTNGA